MVLGAILHRFSKRNSEALILMSGVQKGKCQGDNTLVKDGFLFKKFLPYQRHRPPFRFR